MDPRRLPSLDIKSETLQAVDIKPEADLVCIQIEPDFNNKFEEMRAQQVEQTGLVIYQSAQPFVREPLKQRDPKNKQNATSKEARTGNGYVKHLQPKPDLSIFWKPFQAEKQLLPKIVLSKHEYGKGFLTNISRGQTELSIDKAWKVYCVRQDDDIKLLLAEMYVERGRPAMRRQIVIDALLTITLYYGSRRIRNIDLERKKIRSVCAVQQLVDEFSAWKMCPGLTEDLDFAFWSYTIKLDATMNRYRHSQCPILHKYPFSECMHCKFLQVRVRRSKMKRSKNFMTTSMLLNYTYWSKMRMQMRKLKNANIRLRKERMQLKRKLRKLRKVPNRNKTPKNNGQMIQIVDSSRKTIDCKAKHNFHTFASESFVWNETAMSNSNKRRNS